MPVLLSLTLIFFIKIHCCCSLFHRTVPNQAGRYYALSQDQEKTPFLSALKQVQKDLKANFFFPGHSGGACLSDSFKRLNGPGTIFKYDLPELDGLDNIHCPEGPLLLSLRLAAELYGAAKTWFLLNGSTGGILTAVLACTNLHFIWN